MKKKLLIVILIYICMLLLFVCGTSVHAYASTYEDSVAGITPALSMCDTGNYILTCKLDIDIQDYIFDTCGDNEIDYKLIFGIIKVESNFDINAHHHNNNGTIDRGLVQINSRYEEYYEDRYDMNIDPYNPYDSIDFLVRRINDEREYWNGYNIHGHNVVYAILGSYNMGRCGYKNKCYNNGVYTYCYNTKVMKAVDSY